jgi:hypothetical protein
MESFLGCHGIVVDPDTSINDPAALVEISIEAKGTFRLPQESLKVLVD